MRIFQKGFNFSQDGPGNRLVYHLQGCNLRCIWCSNPEGMAFDGGKDYPVEALLQECVRSKMMFFGGGGVTFTGGEATMQAGELLALLKGLRQAGIHTAIETNATSPKLLQLLPYTDYLIMDFKHFDSAVHKRFTGLGNEQVKENLEAILKSGRQVHVRIPLISGFNTADPMGFAEYLASQDTSGAVFEFLCYHEYGKDKWTTPYQVTDGFVPQEKVQQFTDSFRAHGLKLITT